MKHFMNESHKQYTEKCLKAIEEMSKHELSRLDMKAQCDRIVDATLLPKKIQIPSRQNGDLYLEQTPDDIYQYELKGDYTGLLLTYNEEKNTYSSIWSRDGLYLTVYGYFETFKVKAITYIKEENRIFVRLAVF